MSTYYLSGPMTGLPDLNYPAFEAAAMHLRDQGHTVYSPHEWETHDLDGQILHMPRPFALRDAFTDYCLFIIEMADDVIVLPGWERSPGATAEVALAQAIGKHALRYEDMTLVPRIARVSSREQIESLQPTPPPCPDHVERQHRDRKPPWCDRCGWQHAVSGRPAAQITERPRLGDVP